MAKKSKPKGRTAPQLKHKGKSFTSAEPVANHIEQKAPQDMAKSPRDMGNLAILRSLLLPSSSVDPVFVAIDFERPHIITNHFQYCHVNIQVGLAILDTRCLTSKSKFTTFNFITGENAYFEESAPFFKSGTAEKIPVTSMLSKINDCLHIYQNRNIVLVGHGFSVDLTALKALGFDFQENRVVAKLDTFLPAKCLISVIFPIQLAVNSFKVAT